MTLDDRLAQNIAIRGFESINGDGEYFGNLDDNSIEAIKLAILSDLENILDIPVYEITEHPSKDFEAGYNDMVIATRILLLQIRSDIKEYCK